MSAESNKRRAEQVTHCPKGHEYTDENCRTYVHPTKGWVMRFCRICDREKKAAQREAARREGRNPYPYHRKPSS